MTASFVKSVISHPTLEIVDHKRAEPDNNALPDFMHVNAVVTYRVVPFVWDKLSGWVEGAQASILR